MEQKEDGDRLAKEKNEFKFSDKNENESYGNRMRNKVMRKERRGKYAKDGRGFNAKPKDAPRPTSTSTVGP